MIYCKSKHHFLYFHMLCSALILSGIAGCSLPLCHEGEVVCADTTNDRFIVLHSDRCDQGKCSVNTDSTPCQLYKCSDDNYMPVTNGYCSLGSHFENGVLSCIPRCHDGEIICGTMDENDQLQIKQKDSEAEGSVNEAPCQRYKCSQNEYVAIANSYCTLGSRIENSVLSCIPQCEEGQIVCADMDEQDQLQIRQKDSDEEGSINETPCQRYKCSQNEYVAIANSYCTLGSHIENNVLSCIPQCEEGQIVCADMDEHDQLQIRQKDSEAEGSVNETPCQRYKCSQNEYVPIANSYCTLGSRIENSNLSCMPQCEEGQIVCADMDEYDQLQIRQKDSDEEGSVNETPCQRYKCSQNEYVPIANSYCTLGSRIENSILSCMPQCEEGEIVCADTDEFDHLQIKQKDSDENGSVNETPCQRYKCSQNEYVAIANSYCTSGSRIENGSLICIPRCESLPTSRCKAAENQTIIQTCRNEGSDPWQISFCNNSCKLDLESDYNDDGFKVGICGECRNDMMNYCQYNQLNELERIGCENGTLTIETIEKCPSQLQTKCDNGYVFTDNDKNNCGSCGHQCGGEEYCINGKCEPCDAEGYLNYIINDEIVRSFCIHDEKELQLIHDSLESGHSYPESNTRNSYILIDDIHYTKKWTPLGTDEKPIDNLTWIGLNHELSFEQPIVGGQYTGVFGVVTNSLFDSIYIQQAEITHETLIKDLENPMDECAPAAGGFIGKMDKTTIQNSKFNVEVTGSFNVGGIAGMMTNSEILNSETTGKLTVDSYSDPKSICLSNISNLKRYRVNLGGFAGHSKGSSIIDSHSGIELDSALKLPVNNVGGFIGTAMSLNTIRNSNRDKDIIIAGSQIGGFIGYAYSPSIQQSITIENSSISKPDSPVKLYALYDTEALAEVVNCTYFDPTFYSSSIFNIGGFIGEYSGNGQFKLNANSIRVEIDGCQNVGGYVGYIYENTNNTTLDGFIFVDGCNEYDDNGCISISKSIITINSSYSDIGGLFGNIYSDINADLRNIHADIQITKNTSGGNFTGGLAGEIEISGNLNLSNMILNVDIDTPNSSMIGGLVGFFYESPYSASNLNISDLKLSYSLNGIEYIGGIAGNIHSNTTITSSDIGGSINCRNECGGIMGSFSSRLIINDSNLHDIKIKFTGPGHFVTGTGGIGGITGSSYNAYTQLQSVIIDQLSVEGNKNVGGIIGMTAGENNIFMGSGLSLSYTFINGNVSGKENVGGIIGLKDNNMGFSLSNCILNQTIQAGISAGSIIGESTDKCNSANYPSSSSISETGLINTLIIDNDGNNIGGLIGMNSCNKGLFIMSNSYQYIKFIMDTIPENIGFIAGYIVQANPESYSYFTTSSPYYYYPSNDVIHFYGNSDLTMNNTQPFSINEEKQFVKDSDNSLLSESIGGFQACMMKIYTSPEGDYECLSVPYSSRLDALQDVIPDFVPFCIPEDQIGTVCGSL